MQITLCVELCLRQIMWNYNFITEIWKKYWFINSLAVAYSKEIGFNFPLTDTTLKCQVTIKVNGAILKYILWEQIRYTVFIPCKFPIYFYMINCIFDICRWSVWSKTTIFAVAITALLQTHLRQVFHLHLIIVGGQIAQASMESELLSLSTLKTFYWRKCALN